jgi:hypothetical protein
MLGIATDETRTASGAPSHVSAIRFAVYPPSGGHQKRMARTCGTLRPRPPHPGTAGSPRASGCWRSTITSRACSTSPSPPTGANGPSPTRAAQRTRGQTSTPPPAHRQSPNPEHSRPLGEVRVVGDDLGGGPAARHVAVGQHRRCAGAASSPRPSSAREGPLMSSRAVWRARRLVLS